MNRPMIFLDWDNKKKLVRASFSYFLYFSRKNKVYLKNVTDLAVIIYLHPNETSFFFLANCFVNIALAKKC